LLFIQGNLILIITSYHFQFYLGC